MLRFIKKHGRVISKAAMLVAVVIVVCLCTAGTASATQATTAAQETATAAGSNNNNIINFSVAAGDGSDMASVLQMLLVLTIISLAPSILMLLTSFTRIVIVLHFTRAALGVQTIPPNQVLIGLSIFLTFFVMSPTFTQVYDSAIKPLSNNEITIEQAFDAGIKPMRAFMLKQVSTKDLDTFLNIAGTEAGSIENEDDIPLNVLIPAFIISELRIAFIIGFLIYIPFIVIDMVVSSVLMSMGMMMLPPTTISMPFKILLFVMADGWNLVIGNLMQTFS
ncbi:MAG: flagellar type III secretion system pore protein FliP [[Bacteroides] pectinophilus]|nr:flagellar type III secretion system pore protein FliP [[Bacteroides] pectinophilus]